MMKRVYEIKKIMYKEVKLRVGEGKEAGFS